MLSNAQLYDRTGFNPSAIREASAVRGTPRKARRLPRALRYLARTQQGADRKQTAAPIPAVDPIVPIADTRPVPAVSRS